MLKIVFVSNWPHWRIKVINQILASPHKLCGVFIPLLSPSESYLTVLKLLCRIPCAGVLANRLGHGLNSEIAGLFRLARRNKFFISQVSDINHITVLGMLREIKPDIVLTLAWPKKFSRELLEIPASGCINCHPSLLPNYRGRFPISAVLLAKETITGITYHLMNDGFDTGDILSQQEIEIADGEMGKTLLDKSGAAFVNTILPFLQRFESGEIKPVPQNPGEGSVSPRFTHKDSLIEWSMTTEEIDNRISALNPWFRAHTYHHCQRIDVLSYERGDYYESAVPGQILGKSRSGILVATRNSSLLIRSLSLPGSTKRTTRRYIENQIKIGDLFK